MVLYYILFQLGIKTPLKKVLSGKAEDHHSLFWYPSRCEHQKCDTNEHLKRCGGCNMVQVFEICSPKMHIKFASNSIYKYYVVLVCLFVPSTAFLFKVRKMLFGFLLWNHFRIPYDTKTSFLIFCKNCSRLLRIHLTYLDFT